MSNQLIPFPVDRKALEKDPGPVVTLFAKQYIEELIKTQRTAMVIYQGQPPALPYEGNGYTLSRVNNISDLPMDIQRRINVGINMGVPIKYILIAHEEKPKRRLLPRIDLDFDFDVLGLVFGVVTGLAIFTLGLVALPLLVVGRVLATVDPIVVAVIDDVDEEGNDVLSWLMLGAWYE